MAANVKAQPDSYHTVTPYLIVAGAASAIEFYKRAFDAVEKVRMDGPEGRIAHAELQIGDSIVMLADEHPERGARGPKSVGGSPISLLLYVKDVDAVVKGAVSVGAKLTRPVEDQFYGDRVGGVEDPFGHLWYVATHVEDVTREEMKRRMAAMATA